MLYCLGNNPEKLVCTCTVHVTTINLTAQYDHRLVETPDAELVVRGDRLYTIYLYTEKQTSKSGYTSLYYT